MHFSPFIIFIIFSHFHVVHIFISCIYILVFKGFSPELKAYVLNLSEPENALYMNMFLKPGYSSIFNNNDNDNDNDDDNDDGGGDGGGRGRGRGRGDDDYDYDY